MVEAYCLVNGVTAPVYDYAAATGSPCGCRCRTSTAAAAPCASSRTSSARGSLMAPQGCGDHGGQPLLSVPRRGNESEVKQYDANGNPTKFPLSYDNYFVPRGYALVAVDMAGTARSTGCSDEGAASDLLSIKASWTG